MTYRVQWLLSVMLLLLGVSRAWAASCGTGTLTYDPGTQSCVTLTMASENDDGYCVTSGSYTSTLACSTCTINGNTEGVTRSNATNGVNNVFFNWSDTVAGATVVAASVQLYATGAATNNDSLSANLEYYTWTSGALTCADWTKLTPSSPIATRALSTISAPAYYEWVLSDYSGINLNGTTGIRLTLSCLGGNCATEPTAGNLLTTTTYGYGAGNREKLNVVYELSATSTPSETPANTPTPTPSPSPTNTVERCTHDTECVSQGGGVCCATPPPGCTPTGD